MEGPNGQQYGEFVPGTEILANALNTLLRGRWYSETPDWLAVACAALVALLTLVDFPSRQGKQETLKQVAMVILLGALTWFLVISHSSAGWYTRRSGLAVFRLYLRFPLVLLHSPSSPAASWTSKSARWFTPKAGCGLPRERRKQIRPRSSRNLRMQAAWPFFDMFQQECTEWLRTTDFHCCLRF